MADLVYPGFLLSFVPYKFDEAKIKMVLERLLDPGKTGVFKNRPLQILRINPSEASESKGSQVRGCIVIVRGCPLPYNVIRERLAGRYFGAFPIVIDDKDFGIVRCMKTGLLSHIDLKLHQNFLSSHGNLEMMEIFSPAIFQHNFPGLDTVHKKVRYSHLVGSTILNLDDMELSNNHLGATHIKSSHGRPYFEIHARTRLDALQLLLYGPTDKVKFPGYFFYRSKETDPVSGKKSSPNKVINLKAPLFLSNENCLLDTSKIMKQSNMIPLKYFNPNVLSQKKFQDVYCVPGTKELKAVCGTCRIRFELVGVHPDLAWFYATCICRPSKSLNTWPNEDHFRLTEHPGFRKLWAKHGEDCRTFFEEPLIPLIRGIKPVYDSPQDFIETAVNAFIAELAFNKREMNYRHRKLGTVEGLTYIETIMIKNKMKKFYKLDLLLDKSSSLWNPEKMHGIGSFKIAVNPPLDAEDAIPYYSIDNISSLRHINAYGIEITDMDSSYLLVTRICLPKRIRLSQGQVVLLIPGPPESEAKSLVSSIKMWKDFDVQRKDAARPISCIVEPLELKQKSIEWSYGPCVADTYEMRLLNCPENVLLKNLHRLLERYYVAADVSCHNEPVFSYSMRITRVEKQKEGGYSVFGVGVIPNPHTIHRISCDVKFWAVELGKPPPSKQEQLAMDMSDNKDEYKGLLTIHQPEETEMHNFFGENEDIHGHLSNFKSNPVPARFMRIRKAKFSGWIDVFFDLEPNRNIQEVVGNTSYESIIFNWMERPHAPDLSILDFLLKKDSHRPEFKLEYPGPRFPKPVVNKLHLQEIMETLNPSQAKAVENMVNLRVSFMTGPAGSGKTFTAASAILYLTAKENGTIIVACPSNYACSVLHETLEKMSQKLNRDLKVCRMFSKCRELALSKSSSRQDDGHLHVAVEKHSVFRESESMREVLQVINRDGEMALTASQKSRLAYVRELVEMTIMEDAEVIITTVGAATDGRMNALQERLHSSGRNISMLMIDEGSLLTLPGSISIMALQPSRIAVLGDVNQLPPVCLSPTAVNAGLETSLMHLVHSSNILDKEKVHTLLNIQYRMEASIAKVVSEFAYEGRVNSSQSVTSRNYDKIFSESLKKEFPWTKSKNICIETYQKCSEVDDHPSFHNMKEVEIIRSILLKLRNTKLEERTMNPDCGNTAIDLSDVTVLTFYDAQRKQLQKMVNSLGKDFERVRVASSDSFQGKENKIIILSVVQSNSEHDCGFMKDRRRLTVAVSRSINLFFFVAHLPTLEKCEIQDVLDILKLLKENAHINYN